MADTPFIDHRLIQKTQALTPSTDSLELIEGLSPIALLHSDDEDAPDEYLGYMVTSCDRIALRIVTDEEAKLLGRDCLDLEEMTALLDRVSRLGDLERAAIEAQAAYVRIRRLFGTAADHIINGTPLNKKERLAIGALRHELNEIDAENAEAERKAREEGARFFRQRVDGIRHTIAKFKLRQGRIVK